MARADEVIDLLVAVLLDHPAFQQKIELAMMSIIETSGGVVRKIEDIIEDSDRVNNFIQEAVSEQRFDGGEFRDAVRQVVQDMDFTVRAS